MSSQKYIAQVIAVSAVLEDKCMWQKNSAHRCICWCQGIAGCHKKSSVQHHLQTSIMCIITDTYVKPLTVTCLRGTYYRPRSATEAEKPVWLRSGAWRKKKNKIFFCEKWCISSVILYFLLLVKLTQQPNVNSIFVKIQVIPQLYQWIVSCK